MVEGTEDVGHYFVDGDARVLPGVDYAGSNVLEDCSCYAACNSV